MKRKRRKLIDTIKPREANEFKFKRWYSGSQTNCHPSPKSYESRKDLKPPGLIYMRKRPSNENATKASKIHDKTIN